MNSLPIGLFDSGVGGLTVLKALRSTLPCEEILYLGDTARLPYGTKSQETIIRYAVQAAGKLVERGVKMLVIACNTASSVAIEPLQKAFPDIPVLGVVKPGAAASCAATENGSIVVLATESTIRGNAYQREIYSLRPDVDVTGLPCPLFVPLAEEGWTDGELVEGIIARYLDPLFASPLETAQEKAPDTIVLGCTHFPLLAPSIRNVVGDAIHIVDSAETTAQEVKKVLSERGLLQKNTVCGGTKFLTTDDISRFARTGSWFLGLPIEVGDVELVDL
ncbi:glutamate racemase [Halodesulfovibrio marinisediminis]|uniref:Glutamate racemase n=1 Tax=Halodesulfovibrio marinisediminis DSM 17456 TaxID=1121457 RepID=A0A1N6FNX5_9BACT|nr:glutamate racemase [Halodesulfovibrio marinisediminis]SIN97007.1 glutamate racemase [Halodesulfovibrio marinisediminis DSM 17456]